MKKELIQKYGGQLAKILLGSVVYGIGFSYFCYPNSIMAGGLTGAAMILNMLFGLPIGVMIIVMNIPLFLIAWKKLGINFILLSLVGMVASSLLVDFFNLFPFAATEEPLLGALFGGAIKGLGCGLIYSGGSSFGGVDIMAKLLRRRYPHVNFGTLLLGLDAAVLLIFALIFKQYDLTMYAIISIFVVTQIIDLLLYGPVSARLCYIISEKSEDLKNEINKQRQQGVTLLHGVGAYSGKEKQVLMCVIKRQQILEIRKLVKGIDVKAFLIVTDARDVYGTGFENIEVID